MPRELVPLPDLAASAALAARVAATLKKGDVLLLRGPLGAGKTTFARALLQALGVAGDIPSPTFTLVQTYETDAFPVYHFDLYRLNHAEEIEEIGFDDALAEGALLVEWPEKAESYMPRNSLEIVFSGTGPARTAAISKRGEKA